MEQLVTTFENITGKKVLAIEEIKGSGSNRQYFRLKNETASVIGVIGESKEENSTFVTLSKHFLKQNLPVPEIIYFSEDKNYYLQQDLGNISLFDFLKEAREKKQFSEKEIILLKKTIRKLAEFQYEGAKNLDFSFCYPVPEFDKRAILWDLNYFKYYFLKPSGISFSEKKLEDDFEKIVSVLLKYQSHTFLYRDFQSRNIMLYKEEPYFIDYQGGRKGPVFYDVASFLWQAKANFPNELRQELLDIYLDELKKYDPAISKKEFKSHLKHFILVRILQVLGAYGYRGFFERKSHFLESIPFALNNLYDLLQKNNFEYHYLTQILIQLYQDANKKYFYEPS